MQTHISTPVFMFESQRERERDANNQWLADGGVM